VAQGLKIHHMSCLAFHFIMFFNSSPSKYFLLNPNIFFLIEFMLWLGQSWQVRKSNTKFENIRFIKALGSHAIFLGNRGPYSASNKPNGIKIGLLVYYCTNYDKFTGTIGFLKGRYINIRNEWTSRIRELENGKPVLPISVSSAVSRKRQVMSFEPQHHI